MVKTQSQLRDDPELKTPRVNTPVHRNKSASSSNKHIKSVINIKSPRYIPASKSLSLDRSCSFVDIPEINIDDMELFENIGWGATGVIKRGKWGEKDVAVKQLFPHAKANPFKEEIKHWRAIKHPNVVELYGACTKPGSLCIVMEYIKEGDLCSFLQSVDSRSTKIWPLLYRVAVDVARAMLHIHTTSKRVHRDLKSRNILLNSLDCDSMEPVAKVCDFGDCRITGLNMTPKVGTMSHMAPEILNCEEYTNKVDVYSYGMLLWEIITRKEPYSDDSFMYEIAEKVSGGMRPDLPSYCPSSVKTLITDCWHKNPEKRPDFRTILRRLGQIGELWKTLDIKDIINDEISEQSTENDSSIEEEYKNEINDSSLPSKRVSKSLRSLSKSNVKNKKTTADSFMLQRQITFTGEESDDSYDESDDSDSEEIHISTGITDLINNPEFEESESVKQLKSLSTGRVNLQKLLEHDASTINDNTLITVLKTTLKKECNTAKDLRKHNEFLRDRIKIEQSNRKEIQIQLKEIQKEIAKTEITTEFDLQDLISGAAKEEKLYDIQLAEQKKLKWCEIQFSNIKPESSPYRYSTFGIWYNAEWEYNNVQLCIAIGGIHRELIHNFRKLSNQIQQISNHPNMCNLLGILSTAPNFGILYCVSPSSCELHDYITTNAISFDKKLNIILQISRAVEYCHSNNVLVSWLTNHAIMVDKDNLHTSLMHVCHLQKFVTRLRFSWDSHKWNAPEIWIRGHCSKGSDIYSLGLIIWFIIVEREPFSSFTQSKANKLAAGCKPPIPLDIPEDISELISDCWKMKASERITASDIVNRIQIIMKNDYSSFYFSEPETPRKFQKNSKLFQSKC